MAAVEYVQHVLHSTNIRDQIAARVLQLLNVIVFNTTSGRALVASRRQTSIYLVCLWLI